jgi:hypothetical protein
MRNLLEEVEHGAQIAPILRKELTPIHQTHEQ